MGQRLCSIDRDGSCTAGRINKIFLPSDAWSVMSHFKFVSTINAAEEGCTHSLVLGNRRLRLDTQGLRRASTSNHHPFSSRRAHRWLRSLGCSSWVSLSCRSKGFQPQWDQDRLGGGRWGAGLPQGGLRDQVVPPTRGTTGTSHPSAGLTSGERAGQCGELEGPQHLPQGQLAPRALPAPLELPTKGMCLSQIHRSYVQVSAESETVNYSWKCCPPATHSTPPR